MSTTKAEEGNNVKVESSTNEPPSEEIKQDRPNNFNQRRGGGQGGNRFGGPGGNRRFGGGNQNNKQFGGPRKRGPGGQSINNDNNDRPDRGDRNDRQGGGPGGALNQRSPNDKFNERMSQLMGPTFDLPTISNSEKKFSGRNRLYVGNIGNEVSEDELTEIFKPYGEVSETFINKEKNFAFIKFDFHHNAEKAKRELDGTVLKSRNLKIRFAPNSATVKVKNLSPYVSNELLHYGFSVFGEIERATVCVDDRGKPTGEGVIDFARKGSALHAIRKCNEGCFFLTGSLRPCIVESYDIVDDNDGYPDKNLPKKNNEFHKEREIGPRFAASGSFEDEYGMRWKQLHDLYAQKEEALKKELEMEKGKLEAQMELARYEHETEMLREQLRAREMDRDRQKREWEMKERQAEEQRQRMEEQMRRQQEEMETRMHHQEEEMRRRQQENSLFMQAHNLDNMLDQQEQAYDQPGGGGGYSTNNETSTIPMEPKQFLSNYERTHRFEGRDNSGPRGGSNMGGRGHWVNDNRRDDFPNKRRRF